MKETSELFASPSGCSAERNRTTFDELIELLSKCAHSDQLSLDDQLEIAQLQLQVFENKKSALERSAIEKSQLKEELAEQENRWFELNSQLDEAVNLMVELKTEVSQSEIELEVTFEKKLNYLKFLLQSAQKSTNSDALRQFLDVHSPPMTESPYSVTMHNHFYFQLNATKSLNYDLKGLATLTEEIDSELKGIICDFKMIFFQSSQSQSIR